jgi:hypothetical protein
MGAVVVDEVQWPLVVVRWPQTVPTDQELQDALHILTRMYGRPHAVLHDGISAGGLSAAQRRMLTRHTATYEDDIRRWVVAAAAAVPSTFLRGIITMVQWVTPSPCPFRTFGRYAEAEEWLQQALRRAGVTRQPSAPRPT